MCGRELSAVQSGGQPNYVMGGAVTSTFYQDEARFAQSVFRNRTRQEFGLPPVFASLGMRQTRLDLPQPPS